MAGPNEEVNDDLFPSQEEQQVADDIWSGGQEEAAKKNPVGDFNVNIDSATLERSTSSDRLQIHYHMTILTGPHKGTEIDKYDGLGSAQQASISQQQLKKTGVDVTKVNMKTLPATLLTLKDKQMTVKAKQNGDFYNIYFIRPANSPVAQGAAAAGKGAAGKPKGKTF